ncbi:MAG: hypothetical protein JSR91_17455 [Proteobacteria bacterium]|nr:hypothetical protein [Pseudomonadota bacterium]
MGWTPPTASMCPGCGVEVATKGTSIWLIALGRKNPLFAGSDGGADRRAIVCSLIITARLNDHEPYTYLKNTLGEGSYC